MMHDERGVPFNQIYARESPRADHVRADPIAPRVDPPWMPRGRQSAEALPVLAHTTSTPQSLPASMPSSRDRRQHSRDAPSHPRRRPSSSGTGSTRPPATGDPPAAAAPMGREAGGDDVNTRERTVARPAALTAVLLIGIKPGQTHLLTLHADSAQRQGLRPRSHGTELSTSAESLRVGFSLC